VAAVCQFVTFPLPCAAVVGHGVVDEWLEGIGWFSRLLEVIGWFGRGQTFCEISILGFLPFCWSLLLVPGGDVEMVTRQGGCYHNIVSCLLSLVSLTLVPDLLGPAVVPWFSKLAEPETGTGYCQLPVGIGHAAALARDCRTL
jgi:hypothetical protein